MSRLWTGTGPTSCGCAGRRGSCGCARCRRRAQADRDRIEYFGTKIAPFLTEGHEELTRQAAIAVAGVDVAALLRGTIKPDASGPHGTGLAGALLASVVPTEQKRHSLRSSICQTVPAAHREIIGHLRALHDRAVGASSPVDGFEAAGEALHLIQDSFSDAHTERLNKGATSGAHPIVYIRFFGPMPGTLPPVSMGPNEHQFPKDDRDGIWSGAPTPGSPAGLTPMARNAVTASTDYLTMLVRHRSGASAAVVRSEFASFVDKHLGLGRPLQDPKSMYLMCRALGVFSEAEGESAGPTGRRTAVLSHFHPEGFRLTPAHRTALSRLARAVAASGHTTRPVRSVLVVGHTDASCDARYDMALGQRRARAVSAGLRSALERLRPGLSRRIRFAVGTRGGLRPVAASTSPAARARNRRVVVVFSSAPA